MTLISYAISIPLGIRKAVKDGTRFDTCDLGDRHLRLRDPELPVRRVARRAVLRRLVLADFSAARPDLGQFRRPRPGRTRFSTISGTSRCRSPRWCSARSPPRRC